MVWVNFLTSLELPQKFPRSSLIIGGWLPLHFVVDVLFASASLPRIAGLIVRLHFNTVSVSSSQVSPLNQEVCGFDGGHLISLALSIWRNINWRDKGAFGQNTLPGWIMECWTSKFDSFVFGRERFALCRLGILPHLKLILLGDSFWSRLWIVFWILCPLQFFWMRDFRTISLF